MAASDRVALASPGRRKRVASALAVALAVHGLCGLGFRSYWRRAPAARAAVGRPPPTASPVAIERAIAAARARRAGQERARKPAPPPPEPKRAPVVALPPAAAEVPNRPRFAAEHDHFAKRDQRSTGAQLAPNAIAPERVEGEKGARAPAAVPDASAQPHRPAEAPTAPTAPAARAAPVAAPAGVALRAVPHGAQRAGRKRASPEQATRSSAGVPPASGPRRPLSLSDLLPDAATLARIDAAPMADVIDASIPEGERTELNASGYRYASFFNRLKQSVASHWKPHEALALRDATGSSVGVDEHLTVVAVTLAADGALLVVRVVQSSGVRQLDEAATAAFEQAQPFLRLPAGLLDAQREAHFQFGFSLSRYGSGSWGAFSP